MSTVRLDLGSAVLRAADEVATRTHRPGRDCPTIRRGRVVDESALATSLGRLVRRTRRLDVVVALPAGAPRDGWERTMQTAREAVGARVVTAVPAPVAAVRGARAGLHSALVVDLGAELTEVSWAELNGFYVGASLPWGVRDVRADLVAHLRGRHDVVVDEDDLARAWAGHIVPGRCAITGSQRPVRMTAEDVDAVLAPRAVAVRDLISTLARLPSWHAEPSHLVVGGGALVEDLRHGLLGCSRRWRVPADPMGAVVAGLAAS